MAASEARRIRFDEVEPISVGPLVDLSKTKMTGLTGVWLGIKRLSDLYWLDWNDTTWKDRSTISGDNEWKVLTEDADDPAVYNLTGGFQPSAMTGVKAVDQYVVIISQNPSESPQIPDSVTEQMRALIETDGSMLAALDRNSDHIESQRVPEHCVTCSSSALGKAFYVDPANGSNSNDGSRNAPLLTVTAAIGLAVDGRHDVIYVLAPSNTIVESDEQITINKAYLSIRGCCNFRLKSTSIGTVITITSPGVEVYGFRVQPHTSGASDAVAISADTTRIGRMWIERARRDGIRITNASNCCIDACLIEGTGVGAAGNAVTILGAAGADHCSVVGTFIRDCTGDGVQITGANAYHNVVRDCSIQECGGYGISVGADVEHTELARNLFGNNTAGDVNDLGTETAQQNNEQWAKEATLAGVAVDSELARQALLNRLELNVAGLWQLWNDAGTAVILTANVTDKDGNAITLTAGVPARRTKFV